MMNRVEFEQVLEILTPRQREVLKLFLMGKSDAEIAADLDGRTLSNVRRHISNICKKFGLSNEEGEHYCYRYELIELFLEHKPDWVSPEVRERIMPRSLDEPPFPGRGMKSGSRFYIEPPHIEPRSQQIIRQPGGLLRIFAPRRMGKTSLLNRLLNYAENQLEYQIAALNFYQLDPSLLESLDRFLKWFCEALSHELNLPPLLGDYWSENGGSKQSCTRYLEDYVLTNTSSPVLIAMDDVDRLFEYPVIAIEFFTLVRGWSEGSKSMEKTTVWENYRQVMSYSTDVYIDFPLERSPFNVGRPIRLPTFDLEQVTALARQYGGPQLSKLSDGDAGTLVQMVGGIPHLIQLAFYHIYTGETSLADLLSRQRIVMDIYGNHLEGLLSKLNTYPELLTTFKALIADKRPIKAEPKLAKQLIGLGVAQPSGIGIEIEVRCQLYREYFEALWELG